MAGTRPAQCPLLYVPENRTSALARSVSLSAPNALARCLSVSAHAHIRIVLPTFHPQVRPCGGGVGERSRQHPLCNARQHRLRLVAVRAAAGVTCSGSLALGRRAVEGAHPPVVGPQPPLQRAEHDERGARRQEGAEERRAAVRGDTKGGLADGAQLLAHAERRRIEYAHRQRQQLREECAEAAEGARSRRAAAALGDEDDRRRVELGFRRPPPDGSGAAARSARSRTVLEDRGEAETPYSDEHPPGAHDPGRFPRGHFGHRALPQGRCIAQRRQQLSDKLRDEMRRPLVHARALARGGAGTARGRLCLAHTALPLAPHVAKVSLIGPAEKKLHRRLGGNSGAKEPPDGVESRE
eukprot:scaffold14029_cov121-Isochrysis_galbana.AAC.13